MTFSYLDHLDDTPPEPVQVPVTTNPCQEITLTPLVMTAAAPSDLVHLPYLTIAAMYGGGDG